MRNKSLAGAMPLFLVIAVDSMGLGLLFPILSSMIIDPNSVFLAHSASVFKRELIYGMIIGIYMICWFFGAAILGDLSDVVGRKRSLVVCLFGACAGYILSGVAIGMHSVVLLIAGRVIAGFTAGSQPIAQAAIVDISSEEKKARNIGFILLAVSVGFVIGPLVGGVTSDHRIVSWFNFSTPMYVAAVVSLLNALLLWITFKETHTITRQVKIRLYYAIQVVVEAFRHKKIRYLSLVLLVFISGWGEYFGFITQFLLRRYHYSPLEASLFMMVMAIGFSIGFGVLVDWFSTRVSLKKCVIGGLVISGVMTIITFSTFVPALAWVFSVVIGMTIALAYSDIVTLFSNQVDDSEQGWVMGVTNAVMALSFGITTFFTGFAAQYGASVPLIWGAAGMLIAAGLMVFAKV
jgi:MFS transporter, DHA1 family, tetracycline resistance protein